MTSPRYAFLLLEEHPYGCEMLRQLLAAGLAPAAVAVERSELAAVEREKFLDRLGPHRDAPGLAPPLRAQLAALPIPIPIHAVERHDSDSLVPLLSPLALDLVVLGGTRILRGPILDLPRDGVVNSHPGLLPECRGSASVAWSVYHDLPIGATAHLCDASIDTGDVLLRREVPVRRGATYEDLCHATLVLAGTLMTEALAAHGQGRWPELRRQQGDSPHPTFRNAPDEVLAVVRSKLADGSYAHLVDD